MTPEILLVIAVILITVTLFITEKLRVDLVAVLVMGTLIGSGVLSAQEGVAGFANPATVTVAAMFILSAGLQRTGALNTVGRHLVRYAGNSELTLTAGLMVVVATVSAFINNTAAVAVFLPLALRVAQEARISPSRLLMPLSFGAMFGGGCTLIGTSTNILVSSIAEEHGLGSFAMFEFLPLGLVMVGLGSLYMLLIGRHLIPDRRPPHSLTERYSLGEYLTEVMILPDSPLVGMTLEEAQLGTQFDITIVDIIRDQKAIPLPGGRRLLREGDILLVRGDVETIMQIREVEGWKMVSEVQFGESPLQGDSFCIAEVAIPRYSSLVGQTLRSLEFRRRYDAVVLGIQRHGEVIQRKLADAVLQPGDLLLIYGRREEINKLNTTDLLLLADISDEHQRRRKAPLALAIVVIVVIVASLELMPIVGAAILASVLLVVTGVLKLDEVYQALDAQVLVMLAGILSLGAAMEKTGAAAYLADIAVGVAGPYGPLALVAMFYLMTTVLTEVMSNNATAVLLAPIAISVANGLGVNPKPFLVAVTFAASASFMTPIGYQTNTMIYGPGGYRFFDFTRVGTPLNMLFWLVAVLVIPLIWPF